VPPIEGDDLHQHHSASSQFFLQCQTKGVSSSMNRIQALGKLSTGATVLGPSHSIARDATLAVNHERNVDNPQADQESCTESCPLVAAPQLSSAVFSPN